MVTMGIDLKLAAYLAAAAKYAAGFKQMPMVTIDQAFGGWKKAQAAHFADGGVFDQIYRPA